MYTFKKSAIRENNFIHITDMVHPGCVSDFLRCMKDIETLGYKEVNLLCDGTRVYPNACVPIAGIIQYYKQEKDLYFNISIPTKNYLANCNFLEPIYEKELSNENIRNPFDKIFRYDDYSQVAALTQAYIDAISRQATCSVGVLESLTWCINEVMDNVLVHGQIDSGYVMAQFHAKKNHVAFCVFDPGIGIFKTLKNSKHAPKTPMDAISLAIQEGIGDGKGQGNGLFGLYRIIQENQGSLTITSGSASIMFSQNGDSRKYEHIPFLGYDNSATIVDFQIDLKKDVNIQSAFKTIGGFDGFDIRLDNMIQDDDSVLYDVYSNCRGTATRESGFELRNDVLNTIKRMKSGITLDFSAVQTVSSSFIDEFISKMIVELGFVEFNQLIKIKDMNETVRFLCNRSTYMRIHEEWSEKV